MKKEAEFLECQFEAKPEPAFVLEYQRNVLLMLVQDGFLTQEQLEACVRLLERSQN